MYGLTGEPLQTLYKIVAIFILLGVQLMATTRARVRYVTVHMMAPNGPIKYLIAKLAAAASSIFSK